MAIGRTEDRDTPRNPVALRRHVHVRDPIRATHLGQRSTRPHAKAGHMTATDHTTSPLTPCRTGAVHIWAMMTSGEVYRRPQAA